jgi:hypothetical protein
MVSMIELELQKRGGVIYIPRVMAKMMHATVANSTSINFWMRLYCQKHNKLFTVDHLKECDALQNCEKIREYANRLKKQHILE